MSHWFGRSAAFLERARSSYSGSVKYNSMHGTGHHFPERTGGQPLLVRKQYEQEKKPGGALSLCPRTVFEICSIFRNVIVGPSSDQTAGDTISGCRAKTKMQKHAQDTSMCAEVDDLPMDDSSAPLKSAKGGRPQETAPEECMEAPARQRFLATS